MDVADLPIVGRVATAGLALLDVVLHGGEFIAFIVTFVVDGLLGQPELLVSILLTLYRLGDRIAFLPADVIDTVLTVALVALLVAYLGRWLGAFGDVDTS